MNSQQSKEYLNQGMVYSARGLYGKAVEYYEKAERENPMDIEIYLSKGVTYANMDRLTEASEQFEKALKINRACGAAYYHLGSIAILQGDTETGLQNYNKAIQNGFDDAQIYYSLGLLHEESGDKELAIKDYSKAIQRDSMRTDVRLRKSELLIELERYPEALQTLDEATLVNSEMSEPHHAKIALLIKLKQFEAAEKAVNEALSAFPDDIDFELDRVTLLLAENKRDEALEIIGSFDKKALSGDVLKRIYIIKAQIYAEDNDVDNAIRTLEELRSRQSEEDNYDAETVFILANCYLNTGKYEDVLSCAKELINTSDNDYIRETARYLEPLALKMLGRKEEAEEKYKEAIDEYRRQALERPGNMDAYLLRAMCLKDIGQYEKALELAEYVADLQPNSSEAKALKDSLNKTVSGSDAAKTVEV